MTQRRLAPIVLFVLVFARMAGAADVPRYNLPVGQKLVYEMSSESKSVQAEGGSMSTSGTVAITAARANPDGSRRLIVRTATKFKQKHAGQEFGGDERVDLAWFDIAPDGKVIASGSQGMGGAPAALPLLPADAAQLASGWSLDGQERLRKMEFANKSDDGKEWIFTSAEVGLMNKIYASTEKHTYHFDRARGIVTSIESESSQEFGFNQKGTGTTKLTGEEKLPQEQADALAADFDVLFKARDDYRKKMGELETSSDAQKDAAAAMAILTSAKEAAKSAEIKSEIDMMLTNHEEYAKYAVESSKEFEAIKNKPSPEWSATDIDGKPVALADLKGKVIVLDFWYRGCGWCIYAMPQINQLAADFSGKPVVVLGMNTDQDVKDARFVIDAMGLKYSTIKAEGIPEKYNVSGFPTLIIIDQQGVVRDIHSGYSKTLRVDMTKKINDLLAKPATGG